VTNGLRILVFGGIASYRALFHWLSPWVLIPTFLAAPLFQILLFVNIGRTAGVGSDSFFLIGNALVNAAVPCLFAMGNTIGGERSAGTLPLLISSPASRVPLFLGRALPVILNGFLVAAFALAAGALALRIEIPAGTWGGLALAIAVSSISCTGLGLLIAAVALRVRQTHVMQNIIVGMLIIFAGVNVPITVMPAWMRAVSHALPLTNGIQVAQRLAAGQRVADVDVALLNELGIGLAYAFVGLLLLRWLEWESRRKATLDTI
jgi:ABC-2 type transport system permease protein